MFIVW